jgi:hypothetical protein
MIGSRSIPVLGVTPVGSTEFTLDELFTALDAAAGNFRIERECCLMLVSSGMEKVSDLSRSMTRWSQGIARPDDRPRVLCQRSFMNSFRADGMIVATPTGSDRMSPAVDSTPNMSPFF